MPDLTIPGGTTITVEHVKPLPNNGARFDIEHPDGRTWRIDVTRSGKTDLVTSWCDGELADLDEPDWFEDVLAQLRPPA